MSNIKDLIAQRDALNRAIEDMQSRMATVHVSSHETWTRTGCKHAVFAPENRQAKEQNDVILGMLGLFANKEHAEAFADWWNRNDLLAVIAPSVPTKGPWLPDDSGNWIEWGKREVPAGIIGKNIAILTAGERKTHNYLKLQFRRVGRELKDLFENRLKADLVVAYKIVD